MPKPDRTLRCRAPAVMLQGTDSDAGKSLLAAELACAGFAARRADMTLVKHPFRDGVKVQPGIEI